ncbi:MAG TPA: family 1 glycosylhydrolase [Ktedonobacteraceae bacterium]|nr:family 1 glycosylhydrolase [Ktedonobacteraceae bacterium]
MASSRILRFPKGFLWGTATSSYQYEGGNTNNQWYRWEEQGHIRPGEHCGKAANWWESAESDFALAEQMGNSALRLSVEWSRIEPAEGHWDSAAMDRYRAMLADLHKRGIKPMITLHHFTEPLWFADRDGFANEHNIHFFVRYVMYVVQNLHDLCDFWITINEPNVYTALGYILGSYPPGQHNLMRAQRVIRNLLQAHVEAFYAIRALQPEASIGYCLDYRLFDPARAHSPFDRSLASLHQKFFVWNTLQAAETGRFTFPFNMLVAPIARAAGARDYHGVNYYTREIVRFDPTIPSEMFVRRYALPGSVYSDPGRDNGIEEIYPYGLYRVLRAIHQRARGNKPVYITENGLRDAADNRRPQALLEHLAMLHRAIREGVPVRGYLHWTLVDDFEWTEGWRAHLGLVAMNPLTQERAPRSSFSLRGNLP